jgi:hypothetical protein
VSASNTVIASFPSGSSAAVSAARGDVPIPVSELLPDRETGDPPIARAPKTNVDGVAQGCRGERELDRQIG